MSNVAFATDRFRGGNSSGSSRMDNKKQGHFALFRSVLTTDWAKDIAKLALWVRLLGEATYRPRSVEFAGREWFLQPGQLVTTPAIMARKLRDQDNSEKSAQAVTRMLKFFTKEGMISTAGSPFGTVITITNYARYQGILGDEPSDNPSDKPKASNGAGLKVVADNPTDEPSDKQNKKVLNKNIKDKTPHTPQGDEALALECLEYFNTKTGSRCQATASFLKALTTVKAKGECYTADEVKLVIDWAALKWGFKAKPENIFRMTRFDGYLSSALQWRDGEGQNPFECPHDKLIAAWNCKFPEKAISLQEWKKSRPAFRNLEAVWNGKTNQGNWREVKHVEQAFDLISKSTLFTDATSKSWLTLDWILNPKNWGQVYEQAINEHKLRKGIHA